MATQLLAPANTAATTSQVTIPDKEADILFLTTAGGAPLAGPARVDVQFLRGASTWQTVDTLTESRAAVVVNGPVTYRCSRPAQTNAVGLDRGE